MNWGIIRTTFAIVFGAFAVVANAQTTNDTPDSWQSKYVPKQTTTFDFANVGDHVDLASGALSIDQTDVQIPGTGLPITVSRSFVGGAGRYSAEVSGYEFADWSLNIPKIVGTINQGTSSTPWPNTRCSGAGMFDMAYTGFEFQYNGQSRFLVDATSSILPSGTVAATKDLWIISCISAIQNGSGEGFVATGPDGTKITFAYLKYQVTSSWNPCGSVDGRPPVNTLRYRATMLATQVQDRFGNTLTYNYGSNGDLSSITASDGRSVTFGYTDYTYNGGYAQHVLTTMTANGRTWNYGYTYVPMTTSVNGTSVTIEFFYLTSVTRPDGSTWQFNLSQIDDAFWYQGPWSGKQGSNYNPYVTSGTITNPAGAVATFTMTTGPYPEAQGQNYGTAPGNTPRGNIPTILIHPCVGDDVKYTPQYLYNTASRQVLQQKQITGPGLSTLTWTYNITPELGWYAGGSGNNQKTVTVTSPEGVVDVYLFSILFDWTEGQMLEHDVYANSSATSPVRKSAYQYQQGAVVGSTKITAINSAAVSVASLPTSIVTVQDGDTYTTGYSAYDAYNNAQTKTESNNFGFSRTTQSGYLNNTSAWVLGLPTTTAVNGVTAVANTYTSNDQLQSVSDFGLLSESYTYYGDGDLQTIADGLNQTTQYQNWLRGLPQTIVRADQTSVSAAINGDGTVASSTDARGNTSSYSYDSLSRLAGVQWPTGDTVAWTPRVITYVNLIAGELGMPAGTLRARAVDGRHQVSTYYDGMVRPVLVEDEDTVSGIARYTRTAYDSAGRVIFQSYPLSASTASTGINSSYDALGRLVSKSTTDGIKLRSLIYLSGNRQQVTDASGNVTTTAYQAFGNQAQTLPVQIQAPLSISSTQTRDVFGKLLSFTQSGSGASETRSFIYDAYQRLCKTVDPERGQTVMDYDAASRTTWKAEGQSGSSSACDYGSVPASAQIAYGYDHLNHNTSITYPDSTGNVSFGYDPDGHLSSAVNPTANWSYQWNKRGLLELQTVAVDGYTWTIDPTYDGIAHVSQLTYPDGLVVTYAPDAWGEPTQAGSYATGVQYYPNGQPSGWTYGNQATYAATLDSRQRLYTQVVTGVSTLQSLTYTYNNDSDMTQVTDNLDGTDNTALTYDGLHRLSTAQDGNLWGAYTYQYDALDNITSRTGTNPLTYSYDTNNHLSGVSGYFGRSYAYDPRGNVTADGVRTYTWNLADQMASVVGMASYGYDARAMRIKSTVGTATEYDLYDQGGNLVYRYTGGNGTDEITMGGRPLAEVSGGVSTFLHPNWQGSPLIGTTGTAKPSSWSWRENYDPFGVKLNRVGGSAETIGYTGHISDGSTGLTYAKVRYYDPAVGRFLSADPLGVQAGFNLYAYVKDDPFNATDPTGLCGTNDGGSASNTSASCDFIYKQQREADQIRPSQQLRTDRTGLAEQLATDVNKIASQPNSTVTTRLEGVAVTATRDSGSNVTIQAKIPALGSARIQGQISTPVGRPEVDFTNIYVQSTPLFTKVKSVPTEVKIFDNPLSGHLDVQMDKPVTVVTPLGQQTQPAGTYAVPEGNGQ